MTEQDFREKFKDYYSILQVSATASAEEIKSAYSTLVKKFDPDKQGGDHHFDALKRDILEAKETLLNPTLRPKYDIMYNDIQEFLKNGQSTTAGSAQAASATPTGTTTATAGPASAYTKTHTASTRYSRGSAGVGANAGTAGSSSPYGKAYAHPTPPSAYRPTVPLAPSVFFAVLTGLGGFIGVFIGLYYIGDWLYTQDIITVGERELFRISAFGGALLAGFSLARVSGLVSLVRGVMVFGLVGGVIYLGATYSSLWPQQQVATVAQSASTSATDDDSVPFPDNLRRNQETLSIATVREMQTYLARDPQIYPEGLVTGFYGPYTHRALIRFQAANDLPAEGFYGSLTAETLRTVYGQQLDSRPAPTVVSSESTVAPAPSPGLSPQPLLVRFYNQHNVEYQGFVGGGYRVSMTDAIGEVITGRFTYTTSATGAGAHVFSRVVPDQAYQVRWTDGVIENRVSRGGRTVSLRRAIVAGSGSVSYHQFTNYNHRLAMTQTGFSIAVGYVTMTIVNEAGTPLELSSTATEVRDPAGVIVGRMQRVSTVPHSGLYEFRWDTPSAAGQYTVTLRRAGYQTKSLTFTVPDLTRVTDEQVAALPPISLGRVIMVQES